MDSHKLWVRVDNRLVHGQVIEAWLPYADADNIIVGNDEVARDELQQEIIRLAIPNGIAIHFSSITRLPDTLDGICPDDQCDAIFLLFASCHDAKKAYESGLHFTVLNIGNIHYAPGKYQLCDHVALSKEDLKCLRFFKSYGISLDFRCVPNRQVHVKTIW